VTVRALELAAQPDAGLPAAPPPVVLWAAQRADALRRGWRALDDDAVRTALGAARDGLTVPAPADDLPSVAVPDGQVDLAVDVGPVRDRLLAALRAHATQVHAVRAVDRVDALVGCYALSNDVLAPVLPTEDYRVAGGPASALVWPTGIRPVA
jgi:N-acetyl-1-D-myo-inositol-2-amino-2-deoxy-alpha-D-glucopyranoside deacetylase